MDEDVDDFLKMVRARVAQGHQVTFCRDPYGNHSIEVTSGLLIKSRERYRVEADLYHRVKDVVRSELGRDGAVVRRPVRVNDERTWRR